MPEIGKKPVSRHSAYAARYAAGKAARSRVAREALAEFTGGERDPLAILAETERGRLASLSPIRYARMAESPFAFLRGAAAVMAADVAAQPAPGLLAQCCGDCHLMNFGALVSPEGNVLFDMNDFDETLPDVDFTVDLKRLAASFAVAAKDAGGSDRRARRTARIAADAYRQRMRKLARLSPLEAWHDRIDLAIEADRLDGDGLAQKLRSLLSQTRPDLDEDENFPHLSASSDGTWRIEDRPPLIYHVEDSPDPAAHVDIAGVFAGCQETLLPEVSALLRRYELRDAAFKVVGVGSVGTYCAVGLFMTADDEHLFLQLKEARTSVLERPCASGAPTWTRAQGERVVDGQRIMQAASDPFLGWTQDRDSGRHFYVRHLKNRRLGSVTELFEENALPAYAALCGRTLARAHARSADPAAICGYMGKSEAFDDAVASFAMLYAAQNNKDHAKLMERLDAEKTRTDTIGEKH